jgi:hypothetical protein
MLFGVQIFSGTRPNFSRRAGMMKKGSKHLKNLFKFAASFRPKMPFLH